jgi:hypothetical protein
MSSSLLKSTYSLMNSLRPLMMAPIHFSSSSFCFC